MEERMDRLFAPIYDAEWGATISPSHRKFVERFLRLCPPEGLILDAACGTGKYWPMFHATGRTVVGTDQSQGMLDRAHEKFPKVPLHKVGLQELSYAGIFDGAVCIDAMEYIFPEDWPLVLANLRRALKPKRPLYFTVELPDEGEMHDAVASALQSGLPVVEGEYALDGTYHYYPPVAQIRKWIEESGLHVLAEQVGDGYRHFLVQRVSNS